MLKKVENNNVIIEEDIFFHTVDGMHSMCWRGGKWTSICAQCTVRYEV